MIDKIKKVAGVRSGRHTNKGELFILLRGTKALSGGK